jgi:hypothetical protein
MKYKNIEDIIKRSQYFDQKNKDLIKNEGVVFTSFEICSQIIEQIKPKINETICEPSVGRGIFIFSLLEKFRFENVSLENIKNFVENNLFCFDINIDFINEFKELLINYLSLIGIDGSIDLKNIRCEDFLKQKDKWDVTLGNPPYVRIQNLKKDYLDELKKDLISVTLGNIDLYYAFLEKSIKSSKRVGFIIPNSFIKTKSGKFLREILIDNIKYIYNFCSEQVWEKISTYTCIVICDSTKPKYVEYVTNNLNIKKSKLELSPDKWIFENQIVGETNLLNFINYCGGGLATIKDKVYKIERIDNDYCYIGNNKIEYGICKKVIKATKDKDFTSYRWIIYPYDNNGKVLKESFIEEHYPLAYQYLLKSKKVLSTRDKGKTEKYESWFAYGRKQGLLKKKIGKTIILPLTFSKSNGIHIIEIPKNEDCLVLSGIIVDVKEEYYDFFIEKIKSENFYNYCELNNKTLKDKKESKNLWLSITTTTFKDYKF